MRACLSSSMPTDVYLRLSSMSTFVYRSIIHPYIYLLFFLSIYESIDLTILSICLFMKLFSSIFYYCFTEKNEGKYWKHLIQHPPSIGCFNRLQRTTIRSQRSSGSFVLASACPLPGEAPGREVFLFGSFQARQELLNYSFLATKKVNLKQDEPRWLQMQTRSR